jgi:protease I
VCFRIIEEHNAVCKVINMAEKNIIMIIAPDGFRDEEFLHPKEVFEQNNIKVTVASKGVTVAKGKLGAAADVDIDISEASAYDYDAVVFVGGPGATVYFSDPVAHKLAKDMYSAGKITAAICIAPVTLANAGILKDHKATSFPSVKDTVEKACAGYTAERVTIDKNIVTADGPDSARDFGNAIVKLLS